MFEVVIINEDESIETYDCLNTTQASFVFFRARQNPNAKYVELNELLDD